MPWKNFTATGHTMTANPSHGTAPAYGARRRRNFPKSCVLLGGGFSGDFLFSSGARTLWLCAEGEVEENELWESALTRVIAQAPYFFRDGALWEERYGVERFVAQLPPGCTFEEAAASK